MKNFTKFNFRPGNKLAGKYEIIAKLGAGWEGEVYLVRECLTGIERAAKLFFPYRNTQNKAIRFYAKKLHKLRHCPILIQYHTQETFVYKDMNISFLVSEYVEGELLSDYLNRQPGKRLPAFQALHLLHALASGLETIHHAREYHGDLHTDNIIIRRFGLSYDIKLLDIYHWDATTNSNIQNDVCDLVRIFYEIIGGKKFYSRQPDTVRNICCGLKKTLILKKFRTAGQLREYLENLTWD